MRTGTGAALALLAVVVGFILALVGSLGHHVLPAVGGEMLMLGGAYVAGRLDEREEGGASA